MELSLQQIVHDVWVVDDYLKISIRVLLLFSKFVIPISGCLASCVSDAHRSLLESCANRTVFF
jgi:hypothetical protein